jgi:hypothetical protein
VRADRRVDSRRTRLLLDLAREIRPPVASGQHGCDSTRGKAGLCHPIQLGEEHLHRNLVGISCIAGSMCRVGHTGDEH